GTLIARNSAPMYMRHLRRTGQARRRDVARTLYYLARYKLGLLDIERALHVSMAWISGRVEELVQRDCEEWYGRAVRPYVYPAMAAAVDAHRRAGHVPAILTSATRYLAEPRVVNPDPRLRRAAARRGWPVVDLRLEGGEAMPAVG